MDSESVLLGMALLCACAIPIVFMYFKNSKKKQAIFQMFLTHAQTSNADISTHEIFNNYILALNQNKQIFYFFNNNSEHQKIHRLDLNEVKDIQLDKHLDAQNKRIEKLNLVFVPKKSTQQPVVIELYNHEFTFQMSGELQLAQRWVDSLVSFTKN